MSLINVSEFQKKKRILSNERKEYLPEQFCEFSSLESLKIGREIHVYPLRWNNEAEVLMVLCENQLFFIEKEELSVYPLTYFPNKSIPKEVFKIFKNQVLSVKVCENKLGEIYLSRRQNMLDALDYFSQRVGEIVNVVILNSTVPDLAFCELGAGIISIIKSKQCTHSHIHNASEYLKEKATHGIIPAKITEFNMETYKFYLSYKRALPYPILEEDEIVTGRVMNYVSSEDHSGVFVELHPMLCGILDTDGIQVFLKEEDAYNCKDPYIVFGKSYNFRLLRKRNPGFSLELA